MLIFKGGWSMDGYNVGWGRMGTGLGMALNLLLDLVFL